MGSSESKPPAQNQKSVSSNAGLITDDDIQQLRMLHAHVHVAGVDVQKRAACLLANLVLPSSLVL